jgi:hypothetical protein
MYSNQALAYSLCWRKLETGNRCPCMHLFSFHQLSTIPTTYICTTTTNTTLTKLSPYTGTKPTTAM